MSTDTAPQPSKITRMIGLPPLAAFAIAVAAVLCTLIVAGTWKDVRKRPDKHNIRITGSARKRIVSDLIQWSATIEAQAPDRTAAYMALKGGSEKAVSFLKGLGIKEEEVESNSVSVHEEFETVQEDKVLPGTNVPLRSEKKISKGFRASQVISVQSTNVKLVEKASREVTNLLEQGVLVTSSSPRYFYTRLGELKIEMLAEAAKDARNRAENILRSAGNSNVGRLVYADMGIININAANSTETSNEGNNDTTSYEKDIITIIHAEYEVNGS